MRCLFYFRMYNDRKKVIIDISISTIYLGSKSIDEANNYYYYYQYLKIWSLKNVEKICLFSDKKHNDEKIVVVMRCWTLNKVECLRTKFATTK